MWFLWMFGNRVENTIGPWFFGLVYLACGLGGSLLHYSFNSGSMIPCVGASGAISGIVGCFFVLFPKANFDLIFYFRWIELKTIHTYTHVAVGAWIAEQTLLAVLTKALGASSIAFWAHVGGFSVGLAVGCIVVLIIPMKKRMALDRANPRSLRGRSDSEQDEITQLKL